MSFYRPRLGRLVGFPRRLLLRERPDSTYASDTITAGPLVEEAAPGEQVVVSLALPAGAELAFGESGEPVVSRVFVAPGRGAFTGPALLDATLVAPGPPPFSHVAVTVPVVVIVPVVVTLWVAVMVPVSVIGSRAPPDSPGSASSPAPSSGVG